MPERGKSKSDVLRLFKNGLLSHLDQQVFGDQVRADPRTQPVLGSRFEKHPDIPWYKQFSCAGSWGCSHSQNKKGAASNKDTPCKYVVHGLLREPSPLEEHFKPRAASLAVILVNFGGTWRNSLTGSTTKGRSLMLPA